MAIVLASYVVVNLAIRLHTQLIWFATACFLALALEPAVESLSKRMPRKSRGLAVLVVAVIMIAILGFVGYALVPPFAAQMYKLVISLPRAYRSFALGNPGVAAGLSQTFHVSNASDVVSQISTRLLDYGGSAIGVVESITSDIVAASTVLLMTVFMVLEGPHWVHVFTDLMPEGERKRWQPLLAQMHGTITGYVNGNLIKSLIAAVATAIMLLVLGSPDVLSLSLLVAVFDLIPMIGATLGAVLVTIAVWMFIGGTPAIIVAVFFIIFQQIENNLMQPLIFSKTVEVSPLVTILALIAGATLAGLVGALVAIPVAASVQILARTWLESRKTTGLSAKQPKAKRPA